jgi:hypothetical protein
VIFRRLKADALRPAVLGEIVLHHDAGDFPAKLGGPLAAPLLLVLD